MFKSTLLVTVSLFSASLSFASQGQGLKLGFPSVTLEQVYEDLRNEDENESARNRLQFDTSIYGGADELLNNVGPIVDVNLVFEDGEEIRGKIALSYSGIGDEIRWGGVDARAFTLSVENPSGVLENLIKLHEDDYDKEIVRVDVISGVLRYSEPGMGANGAVFGGSIGPTRVALKLGIAFVADNASLEITGDATRENGAVFDDYGPDYSLFGIEARASYFHSDKLRAEAFVRSETLKDFDSSYEESFLSSGVRVRYLIKR